MEKQGNAIDDLLTQNVDAIGFWPLDSVAAGGFIDSINQAGNRVVVIALQVGDPADTIVKLDTERFVAALDKVGAKYEIVAEQPTNWTPEQGRAVCQNFLIATPDIDLIYSHADDISIGCARAIKAATSKAVPIATGGGSKLGHDAIMSGEIFASVCTRPKLLDALLFEATDEAITKPHPPKGRFVSNEMPSITKATMKTCPEQC